MSIIKTFLSHQKSFIVNQCYHCFFSFLIFITSLNEDCAFSKVEGEEVSSVINFIYLGLYIQSFTLLSSKTSTCKFIKFVPFCCHPNLCRLNAWLSLDFCGKPDRYPIRGKRKISFGFLSKGKIQLSNVILMCVLWMGNLSLIFSLN